MYRRLIKPMLDRFTAFVLLLITLPVTVPVMILLFIANRGNVWFVQERPGKNGAPFRLIKFKTMTDARDTNGNLLADHLRLTTIGKFVRRTSLDELPQLMNVLSGHMSIVGPRPLLMEYLPLYQPWQQRRHDVLPGITGWAQVNGRNAISWSRKFELDVWYVDHLSFATDLKILFLTMLRVLRAEGISGAGSATMEKFDGKS